MTAELLDWVCDYLEHDEEIIVPVKKMWNDWRRTHDGPSLEDFTNLVLADPRIAEMGGLSETTWTEGLAPEAAAEQIRQSESLGLFAGPHVRLESRQITQDHVARMLERQNERIMSALDQVLEALPGDTGDAEEGDLSDAQRLMRSLRRQLEDEEDGP